jgi:acetyltransferase-like isoleucine patch superfamily enzyme
MITKLRNRLRACAVVYQQFKYRSVWGMDIGEACQISTKALMDKTNPKGVHVGSYTSIAFGAVILSHDFIRNRYVDTWIGERCSVGTNAIIFPGVRIGNGCIIAPGSVVTKDVPDGCLVMGNPARVLEQGLITGKWGVRINDIPAERLDPKVLV